MIELEINEKNLVCFYKSLRKKDKIEVDNCVKSESEFLKLCLDNSPFYFLGDDSYNPIAMGGRKIIPYDNIKAAQVWLLGTTFLYENRFYIYKYVLNKIENYKKEYDFLFNYIYKSNFSSINWLKKAGFSFVNLKTPDYKLFYFIKGDNKIDIRNFTSE